MQVTQIKALTITVLIVVAVSYFVVLKPLGYSIGDMSGFSMPEWSVMDLLPNSENTDTPANSKSSNKSNKSSKKANTKRNATVSPIGENFDTPIDEHNGVAIYFNGQVTNVHGRHVTADGYNLGLKYQCVEFVKRYYYEYLNHRMPDTYGHAKDFFKPGIINGDYNRERGLSQYINGAGHKPMPNDLVVYGPNRYNPYGHVAIVDYVSADRVHIVQQNPGPNNPSRTSYALEKVNDRWKIMHTDVLGWLRKD